MTCSAPKVLAGSNDGLAVVANAFHHGVALQVQDSERRHCCHHLKDLDAHGPIMQQTKRTNEMTDYLQKAKPHVATSRMQHGPVRRQASHFNILDPVVLNIESGEVRQLEHFAHVIRRLDGEESVAVHGP